jgi:hypothetical protein
MDYHIDLIGWKTEVSRCCMLMKGLTEEVLVNSDLKKELLSEENGDMFLGTWWLGKLNRIIA